MIEAGEPRTWVQQYAVRSVVPVPPGVVILAPPEFPRNAEGRKVKAALVEDDPVPQYNAANNTSIIKAGTPPRIPRPGDGAPPRLINRRPTRSFKRVSQLTKENGI